MNTYRHEYRFAVHLAMLAQLLAIIIGLVGCFSPNKNEIKFDLAGISSPLEDKAIFPESYWQAMLWGTYRPGVYIGVKSRRSESLLFGAAWGSIKGDVLRHDCQSQELQRFGWLEHDGTNYGRQVIEDAQLNLRLETFFVKDPDRPHEAWHVRVSAEPLVAIANKSKTKPVSLFLYFGIESTHGTVALTDPSFTGEWRDVDGMQTVSAPIGGHDPTLGSFAASVTAHADEPETLALQKVRFGSATVSPEKQDTVEQSQSGVWNAKQHLKALLKKSKGSAVLPNKVMGEGGNPNVLVMQFIFRPNAAVHFQARVDSGKDGEQRLRDNPDQALMKKREADASTAFKRKLATIFPLVAPFETPKHQEVAQTAVASLLGGIGDFRGRLLVKASAGGGLERSPSAALFSAVPSRSFFPRGFLWDEGFHGLIIVRWQPRIFLDILGHWLGLQRDSGWIPREVPLGAEQESRVPFQFLPQEPDVANPPSLLLPLVWLTKTVSRRGEKDDGKREDMVTELAQRAGLVSASALREVVLAFVGKALPRLASWFAFLHKSQRSEHPGCYRWAGRTAAHCLASGLDDYPRGLLVDAAECHLDLHSWMVFFASMLATLCDLIVGSGHMPAKQELSFCKQPDWPGRVKSLKASLFEVFTPPEGATLADYLGKQPVTKKGEVLVIPPWRTDGRCGPQFPSFVGKKPVPGECDPYGGGPCCSPSGWCGGSPDFCECPGCKRALKLEDRKGTWANVRESHSPHLGYVSLFPLLLGVLQSDSPFAQPLFDALDPQGDAKLVTDHGIPSLSPKDPLFGKGEDYWRGKIWANLNYLAISALARAASNSADRSLAKRAELIHSEVRQRFVNTVVEAYHKQGFFFENFDPHTGDGRGVAPFTGWTTSVVLLMADQSLGEDVLGSAPGVSSMQEL